MTTNDVLDIDNLEEASDTMSEQLINPDPPRGARQQSQREDNQENQDN